MYDGDGRQQQFADRQERLQARSGVASAEFVRFIGRGRLRAAPARVIVPATECCDVTISNLLCSPSHTPRIVKRTEDYIYRIMYNFLKVENGRARIVSSSARITIC